MFKVALALILFACFSSGFADTNSTSSNLIRKRQALYWNALTVYPYYNYYYYNYYTYFPAQFVLSATCSVASICPAACPGQCGLYSGLSACLCSTCPIVGDACNLINISKGLYLHPYVLDVSRYVQCGSTPGVFYIRTCPAGLVFDSLFGVCNYPNVVGLLVNGK